MYWARIWFTINWCIVLKLLSFMVEEKRNFKQKYSENLYIEGSYTCEQCFTMQLYHPGSSNLKRRWSVGEDGKIPEDTYLSLLFYNSSSRTETHSVKLLGSRLNFQSVIHSHDIYFQYASEGQNWYVPVGDTRPLYLK